MLTIVNVVAVAQLARCEQVGIAAPANRPRLQADHRPDAKTAGAGLPPRHSHHPVDAARLMRAAMFLRPLVDELQEHVAVPHQLPAARRRAARVHRTALGQPRRAGALARREQAPRRVLRMLRMVLRRRRRRRPVLMLLRGDRPGQQEYACENNSGHDRLDLGNECCRDADGRTRCRPPAPERERWSRREEADEKDANREPCGTRAPRR